MVIKKGNKAEKEKLQTEEKAAAKKIEKGMQLGKYELGRTLGEGNFGKVKYAKNIETGQPFAVKILEKSKIISLNITDQIKREIATLKLLKHPNIVRLYEVLASKNKIYMVLEYVNGGELFDRIASKGRLSEGQGRKPFQQLIDAVSYCHKKGVFHRDLKLENVLVDAKGNIKISDFGLSALPQHFRVRVLTNDKLCLHENYILHAEPDHFPLKTQDDGLLHTTCGSPNYVAPEILANRGYNGATSDIWSCGVILYVILTGNLPFEDRNLVVLYQKIFKGDVPAPKRLSPGVQNLIRKILDPNPKTRITIAGIRADEWFNQGYNPSPPCLDEEEYHDQYRDYHGDIPFVQGSDNLESAISRNDVLTEGERSPESPTLINAFELIGMSSCLDLSGFFEKEDVSERKMRFTSNRSAKYLLERIEDLVKEMGFCVHRRNGRLKVMQGEHKDQKLSPGSLLVAAEVFEISPSLNVVELRKSSGDSSLCKRISNDLGDPSSQELVSSPN